MNEKSAIAIITYNREETLKVCMESIDKCCPKNQPVAVFEDAGIKDSTVRDLTHNLKKTERRELRADMYTLPNGVEFFAGRNNLGVAGNSNRALKWFMETDADHLCLLNDDTEALGDFAGMYRKAHIDLDIGLLCFCDFKNDAYRSYPMNTRGFPLRLMTRMTGMMMSISRKLVDTIGYYDMTFGKFGEEHCDYTNRARLAGFINVDGNTQHCLDLTHEPNPLLRHQEAETSVSGDFRLQCDEISALGIEEAAKRYKSESPFRPFKLFPEELAGAFGGGGIPTSSLKHYVTVDGTSI